MMLYARIFSTTAFFAILTHAVFINESTPNFLRVLCAILGALVFVELLELVFRWEDEQKKRSR